jgi:hypothetical protein
MTLKARLARLENERAGVSRVIVIDAPKGIDVEAELLARGVVASDRDLVVVIADPVATLETITVTVDGSRVDERAAALMV